LCSMLRCVLRERFLAASAWLRDIVDVAVPGFWLRFEDACAIGVAASAEWRPGWVSIGLDFCLLTIALDPLRPAMQKGGSGLMPCRLCLGLSRSSQNSIAGQSTPERSSGSLPPCAPLRATTRVGSPPKRPAHRRKQPTDRSTALRHADHRLGEQITHPCCSPWQRPGDGEYSCAFIGIRKPDEAPAE
jgi:hypothetical protein